MGSPARFSVAVVGCGYWGANLVRNFYELGALACISDPDPLVAQQMTEQYDVPALSLKQVVDDGESRALAVATPAAMHYEIARVALAGGKDVFVEKPLALQVDDARELCELAENSGSLLMVGHLLRYHPAFERLQNLVEKKEIGKLQYVYSNRLNLGRFRQEEDILWSFAPHDISMILSLVGSEPTSVHAVGSYHLSPERADVTTTHLSFAGGEGAHIYVSWLHPYKEQRLVVVGDEGMAVFDDGELWEKKLRLYDHRVSWDEGIPEPVKGRSEPVPLVANEPLRLECEHFLRCVETRDTPRTDGWEGLRVLDVLDRAARSMDKTQTM